MAIAKMAHTVGIDLGCSLEMIETNLDVIINL
jgi:hypothetical protein